MLSNSFLKRKPQQLLLTSYMDLHPYQAAIRTRLSSLAVYSSIAMNDLTTCGLCLWLKQCYWVLVCIGEHIWGSSLCSSRFSLVLACEFVC